MATSLAQASTHFKSLACPAPIPLVFVGVFTEMKIMSAEDIFSLIFCRKSKIFTSASLNYFI